MPVFRGRQQEILVLKSFDFGSQIFPYMEIIKEFDRDRKRQYSFETIYSAIIQEIKASKVFVDLPVYLKPSGAMQQEVLDFLLRIINDIKNRTEYLLKLGDLKEKVIPVVSSYFYKTGQTNTIDFQVKFLRPVFRSICFRILVPAFGSEWNEIEKIMTSDDYLILDLDTISPYPSSPVLKRIVSQLKLFSLCPKIILRSAINTDIQNVALDHGEIIYEADNSLLDTFPLFSASVFGDYAGIKKDDLSAGGRISPGFIYFDATENQFYGFKANYKSLDEFERTIVPDVIASDATRRMLDSGRPYLTPENWGWKTLESINAGAESGKSQAKFKRIAMEHYLHCLKVRIKSGDFQQ